jgi:hypothetical protein
LHEGYVLYFEKVMRVMEVGSADIPIIIPTKSQSRYMMRCKGKEHVEEGSSPTKITQK